jgi:hypothetical protein
MTKSLRKKGRSPLRSKRRKKSTKEIEGGMLGAIAQAIPGSSYAAIALGVGNISRILEWKTNFVVAIENIKSWNGDGRPAYVKEAKEAIIAIQKNIEGYEDVFKLSPFKFKAVIIPNPYTVVDAHQSTGEGNPRTKEKTNKDIFDEIIQIMNSGKLQVDEINSGKLQVDEINSEVPLTLGGGHLLCSKESQAEDDRRRTAPPPKMFDECMLLVCYNILNEYIAMEEDDEIHANIEGNNMICALKSKFEDKSMETTNLKIARDFLVELIEKFKKNCSLIREEKKILSYKNLVNGEILAKAKVKIMKKLYEEQNKSKIETLKVLYNQLLLCQKISVFFRLLKIYTILLNKYDEKGGETSFNSWIGSTYANDDESLMISLKQKTDHKLIENYIDALKKFKPMEEKETGWWQKSSVSVPVDWQHDFLNNLDRRTDLRRDTQEYSKFDDILKHLPKSNENIPLNSPNELKVNQNLSEQNQNLYDMTDSDPDPRAALIELVIAAELAPTAGGEQDAAASQREELGALKGSSLKKRARAVGLTDEVMGEVGDEVGDDKYQKDIMIPCHQDENSQRSYELRESPTDPNITILHTINRPLIDNTNDDSNIISLVLKRLLSDIYLGKEIISGIKLFTDINRESLDSDPLDLKTALNNMIQCLDDNEKDLITYVFDASYEKNTNTIPSEEREKLGLGEKIKTGDYEGQYHMKIQDNDNVFLTNSKAYFLKKINDIEESLEPSDTLDQNLEDLKLKTTIDIERSLTSEDAIVMTDEQIRNITPDMIKEVFKNTREMDVRFPNLSQWYNSYQETDNSHFTELLSIAKNNLSSINTGAAQGILKNFSKILDAEEKDKSKKKGSNKNGDKKQNDIQDSKDKESKEKSKKNVDPSKVESANNVKDIVEDVFRDFDFIDTEEHEQVRGQAQVLARDGGGIQKGGGQKDVIINYCSKLCKYYNNLARTGTAVKPKEPTLDLVLKGPAGSGKTNTAILIGEILKKCNVLTNDIKITDVSNLLTSYQSDSQKLQDDLDNYKNGGLFIDEAYELSLINKDGTERTNPGNRGLLITKLLSALNDPINKTHRPIIILGGYGKEDTKGLSIDDFLNSNPGLSSRFVERMELNLIPRHLVHKVLLQSLKGTSSINTPEAQNALVQDLVGSGDQFKNIVESYFTDTQYLNDAQKADLGIKGNSQIKGYCWMGAARHIHKVLTSYITDEFYENDHTSTSGYNIKIVKDALKKSLMEKQTSIEDSWSDFKTPSGKYDGKIEPEYIETYEIVEKGKKEEINQEIKKLNDKLTAKTSETATGGARKKTKRKKQLRKSKKQSKRKTKKKLNKKKSKRKTLRKA